MCGVAVQPCRNIKSPIIRLLSNLYLSKKMSSGPILLGGGFPNDTSGWVGGVALAIDRGIDLSAMALLSHAFFCC